MAPSFNFAGPSSYAAKPMRQSLGQNQPVITLTKVSDGTVVPAEDGTSGQSASPSTPRSGAIADSEGRSLMPQGHTSRHFHPKATGPISRNQSAASSAPSEHTYVQQLLPMPSIPETPGREDDGKEKICPQCGARENGRRLVVGLDGTLRQFGRKNSNVVEIYHRISKDIEGHEQLTYYSSGVGTYAVPSYWSPLKRAWKALVNLGELAFAARFSKSILRAYSWLAEVYKPGDEIYLFGFSRGAYQARVLAAMLHRVGLMYPGNQEQIPFAYQLYEQYDKDPGACNRFKKVFCREVGVHFVGVWDTVSSIGLFRRHQELSAVQDVDHICYFRHALALDERRVRFTPDSVQSPSSFPEKGKQPEGSRRTSDEEMSSGGASTLLLSDHSRVKEVWFAGSHADIGGGNHREEDLTMNALPAIWMANEAHRVGLQFSSRELPISLQELCEQQPKDSMTGGWPLLELIPFLGRAADYPSSSKYRWMLPHFGAPRVIRPGQLMHVSVAFKRCYRPAAVFDSSTMEESSSRWDKILGKASGNDDNWISALRETGLCELDFYDGTDDGVDTLLNLLNESDAEKRMWSVDRLLFMIDSKMSPWNQLFMTHEELRRDLQTIQKEMDNQLYRDRVQLLLNNLNKQPSMNDAVHGVQA